MYIMARLSSDEIKIIEAKASDLINDTNGEINLPVNLGEAASSLGIELKLVKFENEDALGSLVRKEKTIYVADDMPPTRTAFTIAHELGHYVLHNRKDDTYWRLDHLNLDRQDEKEETEANWFAASLLMPRKEVEKMVGKDKGHK